MKHGFLIKIFCTLLAGVLVLTGCAGQQSEPQAAVQDTSNGRRSGRTRYDRGTYPGPHARTYGRTYSRTDGYPRPHGYAHPCSYPGTGGGRRVRQFPGL